MHGSKTLRSNKRTKRQNNRIERAAGRDGNTGDLIEENVKLKCSGCSDGALYTSDGTVGNMEEIQHNHTKPKIKLKTNFLNRNILFRVFSSMYSRFVTFDCSVVVSPAAFVLSSMLLIRNIVTFYICKLFLVVEIICKLFKIMSGDLVLTTNQCDNNNNNNKSNNNNNKARLNTQILTKFSIINLINHYRIITVTILINVFRCKSFYKKFIQVFFVNNNVLLILGGLWGVGAILKNAADLGQSVRETRRKFYEKILNLKRNFESCEEKIIVFKSNLNKLYKSFVGSLSQFPRSNIPCYRVTSSSPNCHVTLLLLCVMVSCRSVSSSSEALSVGGGGSQGEEEEVLHIGGIFPINGEGGWQGGQACMPAANLALEDVNKRKDLLPGFQLRLHSNDSECEPGLGASVMYNLLYNPPQKLLLLAGCSTVCTTVAEAAKMWNLMVLCYGASSPALSDRRRFPTLFRTHPSATVHNPTRIRLMKKFGWSRVAILQQAEEVFISTVEDLEARCKEAGIEIVTRQSFLSDPGDAVRNLRRQDARIIVGLFYVVAARRVLCDLYRQNLYGKSYVWFFIGWYEDNWFEVNLEKEGVECTAEQMRRAAEGHLTTEALMWNQNQQPTISGMTAEDFRLRLNAALQGEGYDIDKMRYPEGYQEAPLAYDAVWAVALAFNKTMERLSRSGRSLKNFTYTDKEIADDIYAAINSTSFLGVSGIVAFSSQGDRIALTQIEQMIGGEYVKLGYYDTQADNLTWHNKEKWAGGKVPQDRTIIRRELRLVSLPLYACISAVALAGICVAIGLIVFNVWNNHRRVIQSSHPVCNTIMLIGCTLCLGGILVLGADGRVVPPEGFPALCQARLWLLSLGFTLAYGAMFSKVWRVHRFTTKAKVDPKKKVEPWKLYTMVSGLLLIDTVILLSWQLKDPLLRKIEQFPLEEPPSALDDSKIRPELEHCESEHNTIWLGVIYGYKGLVLVFGLFLAYETRSVKLRQINDSRYVGMSIYNVVVLCLITAPVSLVVASQQDANFAFVSLAVIFCCFLSMALIFVPKVIEVIRHPKDRAESKYNPDAGQSREDEEKYHKLLAENDQLQQLIAAKEEKIRSLKQKIAEKEGGPQGKGVVGGGVTLLKDSTLTQDVEEEHI